MGLKRTVIACVLALALPASAHEFWIHPEAYQVGSNAELRANLRVGEEFEGAAYSYLPRDFKRFELHCGRNLQNVKGRAGDRPALAVSAPQDGLCVVVHLTSDMRLTYTEWAKFIKFTKHKDFATALADHEARGLPQTGFTERYSRHAKSLIAVGDGAGQDRKVGLETEIVAEANPYTDALNGRMPVRVLYKGKPRANAQVELFERAPNGSVKVTLHRTNGQGRVAVPVKAGYEYLVDAVVLRPLNADPKEGPVWETLWASLTFMVPAR